MMSLSRRLAKRRRALHDAAEEEVASASTSSLATVLIAEKKCNATLCGDEAACRNLNATHFKCVCPHDGSTPTPDLKCPFRRTVPLTPRPIYNIIPPSGGNLTIPNATTTEQAKVETTRHNLASRDANGVMVVSVVAAIVLVMVVGVALCLWKRKEMCKICLGKSAKNRKPKNSPCPLNLTKGLLVADRYRANPQYTACASTTDNQIPVPILPRDKLCFLQEIGEGCFGKVFKGELTREDGQQPDIVAVKVLKDSATREAEDDFLREVDIMSGFKHSNILSLIGVVSREAGSSPWMVFEFMPHGDLAEVLRRNSRQLWKPIPGLSPLTKETLLLVAMQIASGMRYLAGERFVHRDLACRNCLVGSGLTVKIADFGMSRDIYVCDYYKIGGSRLLPVRWMSPESVMYGRFTLESDVWSYGVILWEIYSLGKQPYYGHSNEDVVKLILQGIMLQPPDDCPPVICELMRYCWKTEPRDRIRFHEVHERLQKAWGRAVESPDNAPITQPPPQRKPSLSSFKPNNPLPFPRPPGTYPVAQFKPVELLDRENYLLPASPPASRVEYLETLPDLEL